MRTPISVFIITHNEAKRICRTIEAVRNLTDDLIVVDSGSTDDTPAIAESLGAKVIHHAWVGYGQQKRYAEDQCRYNWLLNVDADEVVTEQLNDEIHQLFNYEKEPCPGAFLVRIIDVIPGDCKPRRFAYTHKYVRLYHKKVGRYPTSPVHDVVQVSPRIRIRALKGMVYHFSVLDLSMQVAKYNHYTDALVKDMQDRGVVKSTWRIFTEFPTAFIKAYFFRGHFMRGKYGYLTAMNYAFFRHLRLAKYLEQRNRGR